MVAEFSAVRFMTENSAVSDIGERSEDDHEVSTCIIHRLSHFLILSIYYYYLKEIRKEIIIMTDDRNTTCPITCPRNCPCPIILGIATSIAHEEESIACILNAECAKINRVISNYSDYEVLIAIDTSVQATLEQLVDLEGILKAKLDSIIPFLTDCA